MTTEAGINTEVEVREGPNMFGAQFYSFSVDFSVIQFPDNVADEYGPGARATMLALADALDEAGWPTQATAVRTASLDIPGVA